MRAQLDRSVAVVIRDGRLLVVLRHRDGQGYAVLPGGGIEVGESTGQAVLRELAEETGLDGRVAELLWVRDDGGRRATYLRVNEVIGTPVLGGPELDRESAENPYAFGWMSAEELSEVNLQPVEIRASSRALLG